MIIIFLPRESDILPQIGAITAQMAKEMAKMPPVHIFTVSGSALSSRVRYKGRKGINIV